jgi:16S rRNA processing protein RimM
MKRGRGRTPSPARGASERRETLRGRVARPGEGGAHLSPGLPPSGAKRAPLPPNLVLLGEFGRAHGLKGEIRLKSFTGHPLAIADYGALTGADGRLYTLANVRQAAGEQPDMLVARVEGVATREAAEALNRLGLHVDRSRLAATTDEDEFLLADLIGLMAEDEAGQPLGRVTDVPNFGGGDLIEIARPGPTLLLPFTKAFVPEIDIKGERIVVNLPAETPDDDEPTAP